MVVTTAEADELINVTEIQHKLYPSQYEGMKKVSVKATVKNNTKVKNNRMEVTIQALDSEGFEVESWDLVGEIDAGETKAFSSSQDVDAKALSKIVKWQVVE
jgi:hypothetical protein